MQVFPTEAECPHHQLQKKGTTLGYILNMYVMRKLSYRQGKEISRIYNNDCELLFQNKKGVVFNQEFVFHWNKTKTEYLFTQF